jgi:hypothetical protein
MTASARMMIASLRVTQSAGFSARVGRRLRVPGSGAGRAGGCAQMSHSVGICAWPNDRVPAGFLRGRVGQASRCIWTPSLPRA